MKKKPVKVRLLGKENTNYKVKFPYLETPVTVNEYYYRRMLNSKEYQFTNPNHSILSTTHFQ